MDTKDLYKDLRANIGQVKIGQYAQPDPTVEEEVNKIYTQARKHRDLLVNFYVWYTVTFTLLVLILVAIQAGVRVRWVDPKFEIMPSWTLNILVTGMFGQFVFLLKIVTRKVWDFESLFKHHNEMMNGIKPTPKDKDELNSMI